MCRSPRSSSLKLQRARLWTKLARVLDAAKCHGAFTRRPRLIVDGHTSRFWRPTYSLASATYASAATRPTQCSLRPTLRPACVTRIVPLLHWCGTRAQQEQLHVMFLEQPSDQPKGSAACLTKTSPPRFCTFIVLAHRNAPIGSTERVRSV